jgi:hypothetical protein
MSDVANPIDEGTFLWGARLRKLAAGEANEIAFTSATTTGEGE